MEGILRDFRKSETFLILTHVRPDGDAIASSMAMYYFLLSLGKRPNNIEVFIPHINSDLVFIDEEGVVKNTLTIKEYDAIIIVDCSDYSRIEGAGLVKGKNIYVFDHHEVSGNPITAKDSVIDTTASSCTCVIHREFCQYISETNINAFLKCIIAGILSDTVGLKMNVTEQCRSALSHCSENVDVQAISNKLQIVDERTQALTSLAIQRYADDAGIGFTYIKQEDLHQSEQSLKTVNHKAIIQNLLKNSSCDVLLLLIETPDNQFKGSLRTTKNIDLNQLCTLLVQKGYFVQGGGHTYSAGFKMKISDSKEKTMQHVVCLLRENL